MTREDLQRLRDNLTRLSAKPAYPTTDEVKQVQASLTQANDVIGRFLTDLDKYKGDPVRVDKLAKLFRPTAKGWTMSVEFLKRVRRMKGKTFREAVDGID